MEQKDSENNIILYELAVLDEDTKTFLRNFNEPGKNIWLFKLAPIPLVKINFERTLKTLFYAENNIRKVIETSAKNGDKLIINTSKPPNVVPLPNYISTNDIKKLNPANNFYVSKVWEGESTVDIENINLPIVEEKDIEILDYFEIGDSMYLNYVSWEKNWENNTFIKKYTIQVYMERLKAL